MNVLTEEQASRMMKFVKFENSKQKAYLKATEAIQTLAKELMDEGLNEQEEKAFLEGLTLGFAAAHDVLKYFLSPRYTK